VEAHVTGCESCRRELARLGQIRAQLQALPPIPPSRGLWKSVAVGSLSRREPSPFPWVSAIAIAASFVLGLALIQRLGPGVADPGASAPETPIAEVVPSVEPVSVGDLQQRSRQLEALRRAMPQRAGVVRASTARTIADLQDRVALVDMRLNAAAELGLDPAQQQALWQERVILMQSLLRLEYAQVQSARY
jgi:hypothetical protein